MIFGFRVALFVWSSRCLPDGGVAIVRYILGKFIVSTVPIIIPEVGATESKHHMRSECHPKTMPAI